MVTHTGPSWIHTTIGVGAGVAGTSVSSPGPSSPEGVIPFVIACMTVRVDYSNCTFTV